MYFVPGDATATPANDAGHSAPPPPLASPPPPDGSSARHRVCSWQYSNIFFVTNCKFEFYTNSGQPVYTPTGQQQVMVVTRQHPGPPQGGMIQQGQSAPHPQPSPSAGSAYIAHQAAATMHHQMAPPQQPAGPPQQQYIQQPNISC